MLVLVVVLVGEIEVGVEEEDFVGVTSTVEMLLVTVVVASAPSKDFVAQLVEDPITV